MCNRWAVPKLRENLKYLLCFESKKTDAPLQWLPSWRDWSLEKECSPTALGECLTFVHCRASMQVVKRVLGRSKGNWHTLSSECLKSSHAQKPVKQTVIFSSSNFEPSLNLKPSEDDHSATELTRWYSFSEHFGLCSCFAKTKFAAQKTSWDVLLLLANSGAASSNEDMTLRH